MTLLLAADPSASLWFNGTGGPMTPDQPMLVTPSDKTHKRRFEDDVLGFLDG
jgi:hypothetical protein